LSRCWLLSLERPVPLESRRPCGAVREEAVLSPP